MNNELFIKQKILGLQRGEKKKPSQIDSATHNELFGH